MLALQRYAVCMTGSIIHCCKTVQHIQPPVEACRSPQQLLLDPIFQEPMQLDVHTGISACKQQQQSQSSSAGDALRRGEDGSCFIVLQPWVHQGVITGSTRITADMNLPAPLVSEVYTTTWYAS